MSKFNRDLIERCRAKAVERQAADFINCVQNCSDIILLCSALEEHEKDEEGIVFSDGDPMLVTPHWGKTTQGR